MEATRFVISCRSSLYEGLQFSQFSKSEVDLLGPTSGEAGRGGGDRGGPPATNPEFPGFRALMRHLLVLLFFLCPTVRERF